MSEFKFEETNLYLIGKQYKEWGELLMDPKTKLSDLVAYGFKYDVELQMRVVPLAEEEPEPTDD